MSEVYNRRFAFLCCAAVLLLAGGCRKDVEAPIEPTSYLCEAEWFYRHGNQFSFHSCGAILEITLVAERIARVRLLPSSSDNRENREALVPLDELEPVAVVQDDNHITLQTDGLSVRISRATLALDFVVPETGLVVFSVPSHTWKQQESALQASERDDEHIFGLGMRAESALELPRTKHRTYAPSHGRSNVPFLVSTAGYGLYVNTFEEIEVDLSGPLTVRAPHLQLDYFVMLGERIPQIVERFTALTGRPALPPAWLFGFALSKYATENATHEETLEIVRRLRQEEYPFDLFIFDYGWRGDQYYGPPRWQIERHEEMLAELARLHVRYGLHFCQFAEWAPELPSVNNRFIDITAPGVADTMWQSWFQPLVREGASMLWLDGALTWPGLVLKNERPRFADGRTAKQIAASYQHQMARLLYERSVDESPRRPVVLISGTNNAGSQRWATAWSGDIQTTEADMASQVRGTLSMGLSGFPFFSNDLGGFFARPSSESYVRWVAQFGAFAPIMRTHGHDGREPWLYSSQAQQELRRYAALRYQLLPYIYSFAHQAHTRGQPLARPMVWDFPDVPGSLHQTDLQFLWGDFLLVRPVPSFGDATVDIWIPPGKWYEYWSDEVQHGPKVVRLPTRLDRLPLFVREGALLPLQPQTTYVPDMPWQNLTVHVYPSDNQTDLTLYEDDGVSLAHTTGVFQQTRLEQHKTGFRWQISFGPSVGSFAPHRMRDVVLQLHDTECPARVLVGERPLARLSSEQAASVRTGRGWICETASRQVKVILGRVRSAIVTLELE